MAEFSTGSEPIAGPEDAAAAGEAASRILAAVLATASDAIGVARANELRLVNPALIRLFGYDREDELVGRAASALIAPRDRTALHERASQREGGANAPATYLVTGLRRDGREMPIELRLTTIVLGDEQHRLVMAREVKTVEDVRANAESALYKAIFEVNTAVKLLIEPATGRIVDANHAACDFYGWPLDTLRSMRITDINTLSPEDVRNEMENARSRRRDYFRFQHRVADGSIRSVEVHTGPVDLGGEQLLLSIVHDVTERDSFEEQLRRGERLQTIGRLAGSVAHDFNNLLTVMMGAAGLIARALPAESPAHDYVRDLEHTTKRAAELTRQLLAFSSRQIMCSRTLDLRELVTRMEGFLRRSVAPDVQLAVDLRPAPWLFADPGQLEQVLLNLVLNANDAMPGGGHLTLRTDTMVAGDDAPHGLAPGRYAWLTVEDTGSGMDGETLAHIFDPFFTTRAESGGTGLGLSSVYGIVTQSDGQIAVESAPGKGTRFDIFLPATSEPEDLSAPASSEPPGTPATGIDMSGRPRTATAGLRVAVIDDLQEVREMIAHCLEAAGCSVVVFGSGEAALRMTDAELAELGACVSDVVMPRMSGIDLASALRRRRPDLPIVLVSGDLSEHVRRTVPAHVSFLQKPFEAAELVRVLDRAMKDARRRSRAAISADSD